MSDPARRGVLITRPVPEAEETAARIAELGLTPVLAPLLRIEVLAAELPPPDAVQAVLVTSGAALPGLPAAYHALPALVVGDATARRARDAGFTDVRSADGTAIELLALVRRHCEAGGAPLLLARGKGYESSLQQHLQEAGFTVLACDVYEVHPMDALPDAARAALAGNSLRAAMFFSAATARGFVDLLDAGLRQQVGAVDALAISQRTADALAPLPWRRIRVASRPNQDEMLALLRMSDAPNYVEPTGGPTAAPARPAPQGPVANRSAPLRSPLAVLSAIGLMLLAVGLFYVWQQVQALQLPPPDTDRVAAMEGQLRALQQSLAQLQQRPAPPAVAPDLSRIENRLSALEQRPAPPVPDVAGDIAPLAGRIDALERRVAGDEASQRQALSRIALAQAASVALQLGQPLGDIAGAPPALARFAAEKPPTEAALRLQFPEAARRAVAASRPAANGGSFAETMWQRVASLVTVRDGGKVLVGSAASTELAAAGERLDAGDLAGAVAALAALDGPARAAMGDWLAQAQALLDARAALAALARS